MHLLPPQCNLPVTFPALPRPHPQQPPSQLAPPKRSPCAHPPPLSLWPPMRKPGSNCLPLLSSAYPGPAARHTPKARSDVYPHIRLVHPAAGPLNILRTFSRANSPPCKIPGPPLPISTLPCALQVSHRFSPLPLCQRCASPASGAPILCTTLFTSPNMPYPVQASTKLARSARKQPQSPPH